ncbi:MAG TPA: DUF2844 domain-containing protein [Candidatus Binatia bacterium]
MPLMRPTLARCMLAVLLATLAAPVIAHAALGDDLTSVEADRAHLRGALRVTSAARYAVHEIALDSGAVVREYVAPSGTVFAVTWSSAWPPDLRQLLGGYFERFSRAMAARGVARRPPSIRDGALVVEFGGRPRAFVGRAYLTDQMPADVGVGTLR